MDFLNKKYLKVRKDSRINEKEKLTFYVRYAEFFHRFCEVFDEKSIHCLIYFVSLNVNNHMEQMDMDSNSSQRDMLELFVDDVHNFLYWHQYDIYNLEQAENFNVWIKEKEQYIEKFEKLFISLAYTWFCQPADIVPETEKYTDEQVMYIILEFIDKYHDYLYMDTMFIMILFEKFVRTEMKDSMAEV